MYYCEHDIDIVCFFSVPQWAYWTEWTGCSVTCGRGSRTRTRTCDNEFDTTDGYQQRCNQAGSELHNLETRECPLKGAHDFCTCKIYQAMPLIYIIMTTWECPLKGAHDFCTCKIYQAMPLIYIIMTTRECPLKGAHDFCTCKIYHLG